MGHVIKLGSKAQIGLKVPCRTLAPPPPGAIHAWPLGMNQGIQETITTREAQQVDIGRLRDPLMRPQKVRRI